MTFIKYAFILVMLAGCSRTEYVEIADPEQVRTVVKVGMCTETQVAWDRTVRGECSVILSDGEATTMKAPVIVGMKVVTCPEHTNNVKGVCYYWAAWRPIKQPAIQ